MKLSTGSSVRISASDSSINHSTARAWSITSLIVVFATINWADKAIIGIVAQSLKEELGFTSTQIGFAGSAFFFLFSISGAALGFLGDKVQVRWILLVLAALWSVIQFPMLVTGSFAVLLITRIVLGVAEGPATAMANTAVFQWFPADKRSFPSALVTAGSSFAKIAIAPLLALVLAAWGWRACFVTMGFAGLIWCLVWLAVGKEGPYARRPDAHKPGAIDTGLRTPAQTLRLPLRSIVFTRSFLGALVGTFMVYGLVSASITWFPSYFEKGLGFSRLESGLMFGLPSIASLVTMFGSTFFADRLASKNRATRTTRASITTAFLVIGGLALGVVPYVGKPLIVVAFLIIGYGCASVALPMMNAVVSQITPPQQLASTLGIFLAVQNLSGLIAPTLVGVLVDRASHPLAGYSFAYQIFGFAILVGGIAIAVLVNPERDAAMLQHKLEDLKTR
ncbi:MFS transporter [Paraburkholderia sp. RP-4-7]|uniref:MFS transporter n=1 Tax=Paraburkholderia polaris TaxID=2728848 RepID=A0A848ISC4_9BURK|nr:MFS transporter [Paraburkholderia polaris]NMM04120.1 MFS transporter [Paraburkholderia polaris]